jgi:SPP1 family phage portal protein
LIQAQDDIQFKKNRKYYAGDNVTITVETLAKTNKPNNYIPLPFGRKIVNDGVGYVAKPGNITYDIDEKQNDDYSVKKLQEILSENNIILTTTELVNDGFICGGAGELGWFDGEIPRFKKIDREMCIFVYDDDITDNLKYSVRFYKVRGYDEGSPEYTYYAEVYWDTHIDYYKGVVEDPETKVDPQENKNQSVRTGDTIQYQYQRTEKHGFKLVPLHPYKINTDNKGIFQTLIPIIDRLDFSGSDSIANAIDRFQDAILTLSKKLSPEDAKNIKNLRVLDELGTEGDFVKWVQREIDVDSSIKSFELFERLLYDLSPIVNFGDEEFGTKAGIAILYALIPMENEMSIVESYFSMGLQYRLQLINNIMEDVDSKYKPVTATMKWRRNIPFDLKTTVEIIKAAVETGLLSKESLLKMFPENIVENVNEEMERKLKEDEEKLNIIESRTMIPEETGGDEEDKEDEEEINE